MKRLALVLTLLPALVPVWSQDAPLPISPEEFSQLINFQTSLEELNNAIGEGRLGQYQDRVVVVDGTVASTIVYGPDPDEFYAEIELVGGRWNGLDTIEISRAFIVMMGPGFADRVPTRPPREPLPEQIVRNMRIVVAGTVYDVTTDDQGHPVPLIVAYDVRKAD